jgi:hypothetical protein
MASEGQIKEGTLDLIVQEGILREDLVEILDQVFEQHGCPACGLSGLDLELRAGFRVGYGIPEFMEGAFEDVPGLNGVRHRPAR